MSADLSEYNAPWIWRQGANGVAPELARAMEGCGLAFEARRRLCAFTAPFFRKHVPPRAAEGHVQWHNI